MRSVIAITSAAAMLLAQVSTSFAQSATSPTVVRPASLEAVRAAVPKPAIAEAFAAYPKGGEALTNRLADLLVKERRLAVDLVKYVQSTPGLSAEQKKAAERALAAAMDRLGIKAADLPVYKAPPPAPEPEFCWWCAALLLAGVVVGGLCIGRVICPDNEEPPFVPVSPH